MEEELTLEDIPPEVLEMALTEELIEEEDKSLSDEEVLTLCKDDLKTAKKNKVDIDGKISDWRDLAEGKSLGNETEGRSKFVSKETQKAINWLVPNMIKPFTSSNAAAEFQPRTADDEDTAKAQTTLINYQFNNDFPRYQFLHTAITLFTSEGTTVARTGWIHEEETSSETIPFEGFTTEQVQELEGQGAEINIEDQAEVMVDVTEDPTGTKLSQMIYKGTATITKTTTTVSRPDAESIRNEDFYILGETIEESDACIQRIDTTRGELRDQDKAYNDNGIYENVDLITSNGQDPKEAGLAQTRQEDLETYGAVDPDDISSRDPITIYEYYGLIDRDGSGIPQPIVCVWSGNTILRITDNPFPDKAPPFVGAPYMAVPFSFWGNAMAFYLEDVTKVKSAIMRTFIDLMATSTNGINHIQKGALDPLNLRRLKEAKIGSVIEWNDLGQHKDQVHNEIPQSLQDMYELFTAEGENESGVTRYTQGLDAQSLNKTATGITAIMNASQMRTWETTTRFAEQFMKPLFRKWIAYNQAFLDKNIALRIVGDQYKEITPDDIKGNFDLIVNIAIAGSEEAKGQKIIGLLQMVSPLVQQGVLPAYHITKLIAELEELAGFKDLAQELKQEADKKEEIRNQAQAAFMQMPEDAQIQVMAMVQQQAQGGQQQQGVPQ